MDEIWHSISYKTDTSDREVLAEAYAAAGSPWFSGHFPNDPVLPGIAILSMATDSIKHQESKKGNKIRIAGIRRVRFRLPVRPDEVLTVFLSLSDQENDRSYQFKVAVSGKTVCTGVVVVEPLPEENVGQG
jgi:3-hydroxyacyl-[acyl-carrier-protein] dehydratase